MEQDEVIRDALGDHVFERLIEAQRSRVGRFPPPRLPVGARSVFGDLLSRAGEKSRSREEGRGRERHLPSPAFLRERGRG